MNDNNLTADKIEEVIGRMFAHLDQLIQALLSIHYSVSSFRISLLTILSITPLFVLTSQENAVLTVFVSRISASVLGSRNWAFPFLSPNPMLTKVNRTMNLDNDFSLTRFQDVVFCNACFAWITEAESFEET